MGSKFRQTPASISSEYIHDNLDSVAFNPWISCCFSASVSRAAGCSIRKSGGYFTQMGSQLLNELLLRLTFPLPSSFIIQICL